MSSIDHLHQEAKMLKGQEHQKLLSVQYLVGCLEAEHTCHNITEIDIPPRQMKETLLTKCHHTVEPLRDATSKTQSLNQVHTTLSERAISNLSKNKVPDDYPPLINDEEIVLKRSQ